MKVIDLLNKMTIKEAPKRIIYTPCQEIFTLEETGYRNNVGDYLFSDEYDWERNLNGDVIEIVDTTTKEELQQRIDKAIEKLNNMEKLSGTPNVLILKAVGEVKETIKILKGEDNA